MIRLIATDVDGTLLTSSGTVSPRTLSALERAAASGIAVVPTSGRQPFSIAHAVAGTFLRDAVVVGANGAVALDLGSGEVLFSSLIPVEAQTALYRTLRRRFPALRAVSVRDAGETFVPEHGYTGLMDPGDHGRGPDLPEFDLDEVLGAPSLKLVLRDGTTAPEDLLDAALAARIPGCTPTISGAPFLEVSAAGVHKAAGLQRLCAHYGIAAAEVVAFGDNINDIEMLRWAGWGVAMGNARAETRDAADEVTASHDADGIAVVLERLMGGREGGQWL